MMKIYELVFIMFVKFVLGDLAMDDGSVCL